MESQSKMSQLSSKMHQLLILFMIISSSSLPFFYSSSSSILYLFASASSLNTVSQYQPVVNLAYGDQLNNNNDSNNNINNNNNLVTPNGWTPVITNRNNHQTSSSLSSSSSMYASPSASNVITKVVPLVSAASDQTATINVTSQYLTSESISRSSYQKPQNTYMIHPNKYQQAFSSNISKTKGTSTTMKNLQRKSTTLNSKSGNKDKIINSEVMPIPMIKPHRHGATLGFNLPDQGLTLYLDINELATKPMAQNIGLKVVSHNKESNVDDEDDTENTSNNNGSDSVEDTFPPTSSKTDNLIDLNQNLTSASSQKITQTPISLKSGASQQKQTNIPKKIVIKKAKFRYKMATTTNAVANNTNKAYKVVTKTTNKSTGTGGHHLLSPMQANNAKLQQQKEHHQDLITNSISKFNSNRLPKNQTTTTSNISRSTEIPPSASRIPNTYTTQARMVDEYEVDLPNSSVNDEQLNNNNNNKIQQKKEINNSLEKEDVQDRGTGKSERDIISFNNGSNNNGNNDDDTELVDGADTTDGDDVPLNFDPNDEDVAEDDNDDDDDDQDAMVVTTELPLSETTTPYWQPTRDNKNYVGENELQINHHHNDQLIEEKVKKQEQIDNELVSQMQTLLEKSAKLIDMSASTCVAKNKNMLGNFYKNPCPTNVNSITSNNSTTIREIAQQLEANLILNEVPSLFESELQDFMDFSSSGYTIILPSNFAVKRLPPNLLKKWKQNMESFSLNAYLLEGQHTIESMLTRRSINTRNKFNKLFINNPFNDTYTINGQRVTYANQKARNNGLVHVIDGLLFPSSDKDIIQTLKSCGRFDGFVTLAEGTGFADTLRKDGPFTVFVPSNDALQKVPDTDLEVIRRNMTALKEFLMYHVAQGVHYSQDLTDGQYIPSILDGQFLQAGVRVDGCSRRLVEVNVSPLYRADIPASNGVIHVVDWILKPDDRDWCNGIILPRRR